MNVLRVTAATEIPCAFPIFGGCLPHACIVKKSVFAPGQAPFRRTASWACWYRFIMGKSAKTKLGQERQRDEALLATETFNRQNTQIYTRNLSHRQHEGTIQSTILYSHGEQPPKTLHTTKPHVFILRKMHGTLYQPLSKKANSASDSKTEGWLTHVFSSFWM